MNAKQRLHRAEFLINWFLSVYEGRKAPYPRHAFKGIAAYMEELLAAGGQYKDKYRRAAARKESKAS